MYRTYLLPLTAAIEVENAGASRCGFAIVAQATWCLADQTRAVLHALFHGIHKAAYPLPQRALQRQRWPHYSPYPVW